MNRDNDPWRQFDEEHEVHSPHGYVVTRDKDRGSDDPFFPSSGSRSHRSLVIYECGAWRENSWPGMGQPCLDIDPEDKTPFRLLSPWVQDERLTHATRVCQFWEHSLEQAVEALDHFQEQLERGPTPDDEDVALQHLKDLKTHVKQYQKGLKKAQEAKNRIDPMYVSPQEAEAWAREEQKEAEKRDQFIRKVKRISRI